MHARAWMHVHALIFMAEDGCHGSANTLRRPCSLLGTALCSIHCKGKGSNCNHPSLGEQLQLLRNISLIIFYSQLHLQHVLQRLQQILQPAFTREQ